MRVPGNITQSFIIICKYACENVDISNGNSNRRVTRTRILENRETAVREKRSEMKERDLIVLLKVKEIDNLEFPTRTSNLHVCILRLIHHEIIRGVTCTTT